MDELQYEGIPVHVWIPGSGIVDQTSYLRAALSKPLRAGTIESWETLQSLKQHRKSFSNAAIAFLYGHMRANEAQQRGFMTRMKRFLQTGGKVRLEAVRIPGDRYGRCIVSLESWHDLLIQMYYHKPA